MSAEKSHFCILFYYSWIKVHASSITFCTHKTFLTQSFTSPSPPTFDAEAFGTRSLEENLAQLRGLRLGRKEIFDEEEDLLSLLLADLARPELLDAGFVSEVVASSLLFRPKERFGAFFLFKTSLSFLKGKKISLTKGPFISLFWDKSVEVTLIYL